MKAIQTDQLTPSNMPNSQTELLHIYNGLDCCVTLEVLEVIEQQLTNITRSTYEFSKSLQAPILEMKLRGVLVDQSARQQSITEYKRDVAFIQRNLNRILIEGLGIELNHRSPAQLKKLFYEVLKLPPVKKRNTKGERTPTVDRNALEKLEEYFDAQPIISHILALKDAEKKISTLETEIDPDGRMRTSYNIAGTTTGRLSSSMNDFGRGGNMQNVEDRLRKPFIADEGMKFAYIDLEQAESRLVGAICWNLFHIGTYLDACEGGDLHTTVTKMTAPQLKWTGDFKLDKEVAESPFYRQHSHRHMSKVLGHGSNYVGQPHTMEKHTKIPSRVIAEFQGKYFGAFPEIPMWHANVAQRIRDDGRLVSLMGRERTFFGRRNDPTTVREAVAFDPQGSVADILNMGMLQVWRANICQLLLQIHDAILVQYPESLEDEIIPQLTKLLVIPVQLRYDRTLTIPCDVKTGYNFSSWSEFNLDGLKKYKGHDDRKRQGKLPSFMDKVL